MTDRGPSQDQGNWWVVIAYALVVASTQMLWLTFAPIDTDVARDFGVSKNAIGWLANVFPLIYVLLAIPAGIALDRWFRGSLLAGGGLTALGGLVRLISPGFLWAMVGQLVVAMAQPLVLNALTKTATGYLPERSRPTGIAIGSAGQFVGAIVALVMGPALESHRSVAALMVVQAVLACLAFVGLLVALRRPPQSAGPPAALGLAEARAVWRIPLTRLLSGLAFLGIGVFVALSTYLQPILSDDSISSGAAGAMLAGMLVAGIIGCGTVPPWVARNGYERRYLSFAVIWVAGCCAALAIGHSVIAVDLIAIAALGFVLLAALPVMLELTERRMGASGGVATGILLLAGNLGGLILAVIVGFADGAPWLAFGLLVLAILCGYPIARRVQLDSGASNAADVSTVGV